MTDAIGLVLAVVLAAGYLRAARRVPDWPLANTLLWLLGALAVAACALPPLVADARSSFTVRAVQVTALLVVVPVPLAAGRPLTLLRARRPGLAARVERVLPLVSNAIVGPLLLPAALGLVVFTGLWSASLRSLPLFGVLDAGLLGVGLLFALPLLGEAGGIISAGSLATSMFVGFLELLLDAIPGFALRLRTHLLHAAYYLPLRGGDRGAALRDQQHAGAVLWFLAETIDLPFLGLLFWRWARADEREARDLDAELDARATARGDGPLDDTDLDAAPEFTRPWWETDPDRLGAQRSARYRR